MIKVHSISYQYNKKPVLKNISFNIENGDFVGIIGPNGAGKSTLLKCISGLLPGNENKIFIKNNSIGKWNRKELAKNIAIIQQDFHTEFDFSVYEIVIMGRFPYLGFFERYSKEDEEFVENIFTQLDLAQFAKRRYSQLSGGEKQRVIIAQALAQNTDILLLDEPAVHLDIHHQIETFSLLKNLNAKNKTIVVVSHNINLSAEFCSKLLILDKGEIVNFGKTDDVMKSEIISKIYKVSSKIVKNPFTNKPNILYKYRTK